MTLLKYWFAVVMRIRSVHTCTALYLAFSLLLPGCSGKKKQAPGPVQPYVVLGFYAEPSKDLEPNIPGSWLQYREPMGSVNDIYFLRDERTICGKRYKEEAIRCLDDCGNRVTLLKYYYRRDGPEDSPLDIYVISAVPFEIRIEGAGWVLRNADTREELGALATCPMGVYRFRGEFRDSLFLNDGNPVPSD